MLFDKFAKPTDTRRKRHDARCRHIDVNGVTDATSPSHRANCSYRSRSTASHRSSRRINRRLAVSYLLTDRLPLIAASVLCALVLVFCAGCSFSSSDTESGGGAARTFTGIPNAASQASNTGMEEQQSVGDAIAQICVYMACTASPEERIKGPKDNPWYVPDDPRVHNLVTIVDATLKAWGGNYAYASCAQAACAAIAAAADPDIAPSKWPGGSDGSNTAHMDEPWQEGMGGSQGVMAVKWYCTQRPELYQKVGENLSESELEPGDLIVTNTHVMIYVGNEAARERFPDTDSNMYEASYSDGSAAGNCLYAGLTNRSDLRGTVFRLKKYNTNAAHEILDWKAMLGISDGSGSGSAGASSDAKALVEAVRSYIGSGYSDSGYNWTGSPSSSWFTCSGIVDCALGNPPRTNSPESLYKSVVEKGNYTTDRSKFKYGDLIFYYYAGREPGHVGVYIGNDKVIDSIPNGGVQIRNIDFSADVMGGGSYF